jgi:hypothetical protein
MRIAAIAIPAVIAATNLNAQQATFNLPVAARWGSAVLQPGPHKISAPPAVAQNILYVYTKQHAQMSVASTTELLPSNVSQSFLHLENVGGTYFITEYTSVASGKKFVFAKPSGKYSVTPRRESQVAALDIAVHK